MNSNKFEELIKQYQQEEPCAEQLRGDVMALRRRLSGLTQEGVPPTDQRMVQLREDLRVLEQEMLIAEYLEDCIRATLTENYIQTSLAGDDMLADDGQEY